MSQVQATTINPWGLPNIEINQVNQLPARPGIYFALFEDQILYIGMTAVSLRQRWVGHHRQGDLTSIDGIKLAYLAVENPDGLKRLERDLITIFQPVLNDGPVYNRKRSQATKKDYVLPLAYSSEDIGNMLGFNHCDLDDDDDLAVWIEQQKELEYFALGLYE